MEKEKQSRGRRGRRRKEEPIADPTGTHVTMLSRSNSLVGRFNPGESEAHYKKHKTQRVQECMLWLKFKLMVNMIQKEIRDIDTYVDIHACIYI